MKFSIIGPGFQVMVEEISLATNTEESYQFAEVIQKYKALIELGKPFIITAADDGPKVIYYPKPGDHFIMMTEKQFNKFALEQKYMQQQQQVRGHR